MRLPRSGIGWLMTVVAISTLNYVPYRACYYFYCIR